MIQNQCFPSGLYCSIWKCAVILHTWQESQQLPFLPGPCGFLPLFHLKLHSFTSKVPPLFTAHFLPFSSQPWERVYSAARAARKKRVDFLTCQSWEKMHWLACDCRFAYHRKCQKEYVRIKYLYGRAEASAVAANKWNEAWVWETRGDTGNKRQAGTIERGRCADCHFWPPHHTSTFTIDCIRPAKQPRHIRQETDSG